MCGARLLVRRAGCDDSAAAQNDVCRDCAAAEGVRGAEIEAAEQEASAMSATGERLDGRLRGEGLERLPIFCNAR